MNKAKHTARKRRNLLRKGMTSNPQTFLGRWAKKIWDQGTGFHILGQIDRLKAKLDQDASSHSSPNSLIESGGREWPSTTPE